jgi:hypothetical protein
MSHSSRLRRRLATDADRPGVTKLADRPGVRPPRGRAGPLLPGAMLRCRVMSSRRRRLQLHARSARVGRATVSAGVILTVPSQPAGSWVRRCSARNRERRHTGGLPGQTAAPGLLSGNASNSAAAQDDGAGRATAPRQARLCGLQGSVCLLDGEAPGDGQVSGRFCRSLDHGHPEGFPARRADADCSERCACMDRVQPCRRHHERRKIVSFRNSFATGPTPAAGGRAGPSPRWARLGRRSQGAHGRGGQLRLQGSPR